jgi:SagB-type dehydrogenase family enzyme
MTTRDTKAAREYHERTKHTVERLRANRHFLDWEIQPLPFKIYPALPPIPLPRDWAASAVPALAAIAAPPMAPTVPRVPTLRELGRVLHFSAGVTRAKSYPGGQHMHFRAAACTGALYHIDLYVVCGDLPDRAAGVYHFSPHDFALRQLRAGEHRAVAIEASGGHPAVAAAPVVLVSASTFWRNAWKYQARAYRHCFWDNGTILANLLAVAAADGLPAHLVMGFVDEAINHLLGLDAQREAALSLVTLGFQPGPVPAPVPVPALSLDTVPLSPREVDYPLIRAAHAASCLTSAEEVRAWRGVMAARALPPPGDAVHPLAPPGELQAESIDAVITRRGSARQFRHAPITLTQLSTVLRQATCGVAADFLDAPGGLNDLYLIVNAVDGLPSGTYVYRGDDGALELLRRGSFRREAGFLGLGQELPADAAVNIYLLCDLDPVLARFGNRGYRVAQQEAAIVGGKLYLAAYALGLGATGLTFFDDDVTAFFSPHAAGKSVMFLVALGHGRRRSLPAG